jgi:hypothetical protein
MAFEVYTGTRPGRPRLLLIVNAALLAGTAALAWWQVRESRGLGPEQRVHDTPLLVRLPDGWQADPHNPRSFVLPVGARRGGRSAREFERRIEFDFTRLPTFRPLDQLLRLPELENLGQIAQVRRAHLGRCDAIEVHYVLPVQIGRLRVHGEIIARFTCLPRGHLIKVVYEPLIDLRPADEQILDDVCRTLRIDDPTLNGAPADYLARAGLKLPLEPDWQVVGADFEAVAGVFLGGSTDKGPARRSESPVATWAIGLLRTWLAAGRTPQDLLSDVAAREWLIWDVQKLIREQRRADGATCTTIRHPEFGAVNVLLPSAWVVSRSASQAVILLVYAGPEDAAQADAAAEKLATELQLEPLQELAELADAQAAGAKLVADLHKSGPVARWGRESAEATYRRVDPAEMVVVRRSAVQRDPAQGYEGSLWRRTDRAREEQQGWTLDGQAAAYKWQADLVYGSSLIHIAEQRARATGAVRREILIDERERQRFDFTPGAAFVPPPAEEIIKGWVARNEAAAAIVEMSSVLGSGTHTAWLRHLAPDGPYPRVLVQEDYWPLGSIEAYDDARAQTQYELYPSAEYRRVK